MPEVTKGVVMCVWCIDCGAYQPLRKWDRVLQDDKRILVCMACGFKRLEDEDA